MAMTNLAALWPIHRFYANANYVGVIVGFCAMVSSGLYHLFECKKHRMPGMGVLDTWKSYQILINMDRVCAVTAISYAMYNVQNLMVYFGAHWLLICASLSCLMISESDRESKILYMLTHSAWHVSAFYLLYLI